MIDFTKRIKKEIETRKVNPIELYEDLDRSSQTGPLRPVQESVLKEWYFNQREKRDLIIKLHTGEGKTLIGLLILQSKINANEGPCMYICPNKFLADQAFYEAKKFGIKVCLIDEMNNFPNDFLEGKAVLLTYVQKVFNGRTIFGLDNHFKKINTLVMDDAHACLDAIKNAYTIVVNRNKNSNIYNKFLELFESELKDQGEGTFIDITENYDYESIMMVPYWAWIDRISEVISILAPETEQDFLKFSWPLLRDELEKCDVYLNGKEIQIVPHAFNVKRFGSFDKAKQRILMSATTQDDIFFVKNLGVSIEAIENPLVSSDKRWSGEKMIIIPSQISDQLNREIVINYICKFNWNKFGVCALVPSYVKRDDYADLYCELIDSKNIFEGISRRQDGKYGKTLVIANRYDGIDLPDDACRILIIDSLPYFGNMSDIYEENGRIECELIRRKIAQKIEQGLGRGVRGDKDYCCILIIGADLVKFLMSVETRSYFSKQTRKQIEIGLAIAEMAEDEKADKDTKFLMDLIKQSVLRDEGWKEYYKTEMDTIENESIIPIQDTLLAEKEADEYFIEGKYERSCEVLQNFLDREINLKKEDKSWYLQQIARRKYLISRVESEQYQKAAFEGNRQLLKPKNDIEYNPLIQINASRTQNIRKVFSNYSDYQELMLDVNKWLEDLSIGVKSEKFENALDNIGRILGYECDRPDKLIKRGPDNLWHVGNNKYILIECKSEVKDDRSCIHKSEAGQMENHCGWFEEIYHDASVLRVMIISTNKLATNANFTHDIKIMRKKNLKKIKSNILKFVKELKNYDINNLTDDLINTILNQNYLSDKNIWNDYVENWTRQ